jgi:N-acetylglucosamine-6-phosphate deacetylase
MIVLAGGRVVLPDRVLTEGSVVIDQGRIVGIHDGSIEEASGADVRPMRGRTLVPGFIDVHVHGVEGTDVLEGPSAVGTVASRLPRYGVTAFCPTSVACTPADLQTFLAAVAAACAAPARGSARVLPAHLESNFINPAWNGAQPAHCLRSPASRAGHETGPLAFSGHDITRVIAAGREAVAIVTMAPELDGGLDLVRLFREAGHIVSIGHSGATYAEARAAIAAGVTHATHLFNRMTPLSHREPGVVGAVLDAPEVAAEVICDGYHVHPSVVRLALQAKTAGRLMAITDGTAASGLPVGSRAMLGGRPIVVTPRSAELEDGTLAGSVITMDRAFRMLVRDAGVPLEVAARLCATTAAERLGLGDQGRIAVGARADLVVLDEALLVAETWIDGVGTPEH